MGKKDAPPAPPPPDPSKVTLAQSAGDIQTAIAQGWLGNPNTIGPTGSQTNTVSQYIPIQIPDGNGGFQTFQIPQFTQTQTLSEDQQKLLDQQENLGALMNSTAFDQIDRLGNVLNAPVSFSQAPFGYNNVAGFNGFTDPRSMGGPSFFDLTANQRPNLQAPVVGQDPNFERAGPQGQLETVGNMNPLSRAGGMGQLSNAGDMGPLSNVSGYQSPFSSRADVENALYARLDPKLQRDKAALETNLINQGFQRGTQGFDQSMDEFNRQANDQRLGVTVQGGQEEGRQVQNAIANYNAAMSGTGFNNQNAQDQFAAQLSKLGLNNQNTQNQFAAQLSQLGFNNQNTQNEYQSGIQGAGQRNTATKDQFQAMLQQMGYNNPLSQQEFDNLNSIFGQQNQVGQQSYENEQQALSAQGAQNQQAWEDQLNQITQANANAQQAYQLYQSQVSQQQALRQQGVQEQMQLRNQPINEISALMSGGQVSQPQFAQWNSPTLQPYSLAQNTYNSAKLAQDAWSQQAMMKQQQNNALTGGLFGMAGMGLYGLGKFASDVRLKEDISYLATLNTLFGPVNVYSFKYIDRPGYRIGVMAQELAETNPAAVFEGPDGFLWVDYGMIH